MTELANIQSSLTKNQRLVFNTLLNAEGPLSAYNILDELREVGFKAPLQVYRALEKLLQIGIVHRLECLNAFVVCNQPGCDSHNSAAFAICEICGQVTEFSDSDTRQCLKSWAGKSSFQLDKSMIELRGKCKKCSQ